jgi:hypothetical protein
MAREERNMRRGRHIAHFDETANNYKILVGRAGNEKIIGKPSHRSQCDIKIYLTFVIRT